MDPTTEVTAHLPAWMANPAYAGSLEKVKKEFLEDVRAAGYEPVNEPEVRRYKFFPGAIDLSAAADGYRYYLSVMIRTP